MDGWDQSEALREIFLLESSERRVLVHDIEM